MKYYRENSLKVYSYSKRFCVLFFILGIMSLIGVSIFSVVCIYWGLKNTEFELFLFALLAICALAMGLYFLSHTPKTIKTDDYHLHLEGWFDKKESIPWNQVIDSYVCFSVFHRSRPLHFHYRIIKLNQSKRWGKFFIVYKSNIFDEIKEYAHLIEEIKQNINTK